MRIISFLGWFGISSFLVFCEISALQQNKYQITEKLYYTMEKTDKYCGMETTLVMLYNKELAVGYLYYVKLPFNTVVIYNFFIEHLYRHQGYGSLLLQFICDYLQTQHVKRIIIQPGPFDYEQNMYQSFTGDEYQQRLQSLVQFYTKLGKSSQVDVFRSKITVSVIGYSGESILFINKIK